MDSPTGFDDDDFFGSYDAEKARAGMSVSPLEFEDADQPPTQEQLAHWGRFRKPVGIVVGAMALLSLVALGKRGTPEPASERPLVAHYGSALAAASTASTARIDEPRSTNASSRTADAPSDLLPEGLSTLAAEVWSVFVPSSPSVAGTTVPLLVTGETDLEPPHASPDPARIAATDPPDSCAASAFTAPAAPMCLLSADAADRPALDLRGAGGQAPSSWSLPPSTTCSSPSVRP